MIGASRTDAGVHARGNVAVFDTESSIPPERIAYAVNRGLPEDAKRDMMVENRSISLAVQVSRQMLAIYAALGFKDEGPRQGGEDDEL